MLLGAIADDVTGGSDLRQCCEARGLTVIQTLGLPRAPLPPADAVVLSLKTRTATVEVATDQARAAAEVCSRLGATQLYLKTVRRSTRPMPAISGLQTSHFLAFDADTRTWIAETIAERWGRVPPSAGATSDPLDPP